MADQTQLAAIAEAYLSTLLSGNGSELLDLVGEDGVIDDPHEGRLAGKSAIETLPNRTRDWLAGSKLSAQHLRTTQSPTRVCSEDILHIQSEDEHLQLPVGTVVANATDSDAVVVHVYYTLWPFNKHHTKRGALYSEPQTEAEHTGVIYDYFQSLVSGDLQKTLQCFEADIYFREASGPPYTHWGTDAVKKYFMGLFGKGAPMIRDDTIIDDGRCAVMEFTVVGWNGVPRERSTYECGLAVYQRSSDELISSIRIYDDVAF